MKIIKLLVLPIVLILFGCEKDLYDEHLHQAKVKSEISLEQFKRETGLNDFIPTIKIKLNEANSLQRNADGSYELSDFDIDTSIIKRIVVNQKITYTFQLTPKEEVNDRIFNIVYYFKEGWQYNIFEIKPTPENLIELKLGLTEKIDGTLTKVFQSYPVQTFDNCTVVTIWIENCWGFTGTCDGCTICLYHTSVLVCGQSPSYLYLDPGPSTGGGGGGGGGASSTTSPPLNDENAIATSPIINVPTLDAPKNPCSELKKFNTNNTIQQALRILKVQSSGSQEHGNYISDATNALGANYLSFPVIPTDPKKPTSLDITDGLNTGKVKGAMHCHTDPVSTNAVPMFSPADLSALLNISIKHIPANNVPKDYAEYTVMLSVGSGHYALKFKNYSNFVANFGANFASFDADLNTFYSTSTPSANSNTLIKDFLKALTQNNLGDVGLYKATETTNSAGVANITGWKEQTLDTNGNIAEVPCT